MPVEDRIRVQLAQDEHAWIKAKAQEDGRTVSGYVRRIIKARMASEQELVPHTDRAAR